MPVTQDEFRAALSRFASGVTVVTTKDARGILHGITVSAFCSVSLEPPLVLICIEKITGSHYAFEESNTFVVNILREGQHNLSEHFASQFPDKFDEIEYSLNAEGVPVLEGALVNLECRLQFAHPGGDHSIFVGEVEKVTVRDGLPLVHFQSEYRELGD
jgi:flavin reductase ActVB